MAAVRHAAARGGATPLRSPLRGGPRHRWRGNLLVGRDRGGKPRVDRFIHGRAEGPIKLDVRAA